MITTLGLLMAAATKLVHVGTEVTQLAHIERSLSVTGHFLAGQHSLALTTRGEGGSSLSTMSALCSEPSAGCQCLTTLSNGITELAEIMFHEFFKWGSFSSTSGSCGERKEEVL